MTNTDTAPRYLTTAEVADYYRASVATIRYWRHTGYGPKAVKVGRHVLYPIEELERFDAEVRVA